MSKPIFYKKKKKKDIINVSFVEYAQRVVKIKSFDATDDDNKRDLLLLFDIIFNKRYYTKFNVLDGRC